jgi:hypothetical protein
VVGLDDVPFKKSNPVFINIDIPTKKFTIHHQCVYTNKMKETSFKGIGQLKRDGGLLQIGGLKEAENLFEERYRDYTFITHC